MALTTAVLLVVHGLLWAIAIGNLIYVRRQRAAGEESPFSGLVSIIIPARNEAANLTVLLPSILEQSYRSYEVIVFDDDSDDATADVVGRFLEDDRLKYIRGDGPPPGWVGKTAALHAATRVASGDLYLFLDADVGFRHPDALRHVVESHRHRPDSVSTALPALTGAGLSIVSLVPFTTLSGLPWFLIRRTKSRLVAALNGQVWMMDAKRYHDLEPHERVRGEILEDVEIGRYLKTSGVFPRLIDLTDHAAVRMYASFGDAWRGFRKNAYLLMGGHPVPFVVYLILFAAATWLSPAVWLGFLISAWALKILCDRLADIPVTVSLLAPVSFMLATFLQLDSALAHWRGRVTWKDRSIVGD